MISPTPRTESVDIDRILDEVRNRAATANGPEELADLVMTTLQDLELDLRNPPSLEVMKQVVTEAYRTLRCTTH